MIDSLYFACVHILLYIHIVYIHTTRFPSELGMISEIVTILITFPLITLAVVPHMNADQPPYAQLHKQADDYG